MPVTDFAGNTVLLETGLDTVYRDSLKLRGIEYTEWLEEVPAKRWFENEMAVSGLGVMGAKEIGGTYPIDTFYRGPERKHALQSWALGLEIQEEAWVWELYGVLAGLVKELASSAIVRKNLLAFELLNRSIETAPPAEYKDYRGEPLCAVAHSRLDQEGTWSNKLASGAGLSFTALQAALIQVERTVNERGLYAILRPELLITGTSQQFVAQTLLRTEGAPGTANNDINVLKGKGLRPFSSPYIGSDLAWWLHCGKKQLKLRLRIGRQPTLQISGDFRTRNRLYMSAMWAGVDVFDGMGLYASEGDGTS